jgi:hypothetical protein
MYDFLLTEGTNPCEGSQTYLHESAEPLPNTYDPENDGIYLSESIGIHEHWNKSIDIFSTDRYIGPSEDGIDFVAMGEEHVQPNIFIKKPKENWLHLDGNEIIPLGRTVIIGNIDIEVEVYYIYEEIEKIEFYIDDELKATITEPPYSYYWDETSLNIKHEIEVIAYYNGETLIDNLNVWRFF